MNYQPESRQEWETPIPFDEIFTPNFPVDALPSVISAYVLALAESTQTPVEMGAALSLGILATAIQRNYDVAVTADWKEPLCLYLSIVADPGEKKSAVISSMSKPVFDFEQRANELEAVDIMQSQTKRAILEKRLVTLQNQAVKATKSSSNTSFDEALALSEEIAQFKDISPTRLFVDDTTPEKLIDLMEKQNGCITIASAEGGIFDSMLGRYDKVSSLDIYLKGHSGDPISVDRIGRKSNNIQNPRLTMMLMIQPQVLDGMMGNAAFRGRGLCARFLYVVCKSKVGYRNVDPLPIPEHIRSDYYNFVQRIFENDGSGIITLSDEAKSARIEYHSAVEKRLVGEWEHIRDWGNKLVGAMLRIAALIHAAEIEVAPCDTPISGETVMRAISITEFFGFHAMSAYQSMGADKSQSGAKYILRKLETLGVDVISKRDLHRASRTMFKKAEDVRPAIQMLMEMGYIREYREETGGRASEKILVNPLWTKRTEAPKANNPLPYVPFVPIVQATSIPQSGDAVSPNELDE